MKTPARSRQTTLVVAALFSLVASTESAQISTQLVASGLESPLFVTSPPDDARLFVVQQNGIIRIVLGGSLLPEPFLDLSSIVTFSGEQGLLGMAFHPDYAMNGFFYVIYSTPGSGVAGDSILARYQVSVEPNVADAGSATTFLSIPQPFGNHNGGMLAFRPADPNNLLYVSLGDGGSGGDPLNHGQDLMTRLGGIIRIDVDAGPETPAASNPFVGQPGNDFIYMYGLRNPWRFSFDRLTGDMYIGDVGQGAIEEIDFQPASSAGGENYGWNLLEGTADFNCTDCDTDRANTVLPIHEYGRSDGFSVIGGYVYRGSAIPSLQGTYFFADLNGRVWSFNYDGVGITNFQERVNGFVPSGLSIVSFGEDSDGELYIVDIGGSVYRIVDLTSSKVTGTIQVTNQTMKISRNIGLPLKFLRQASNYGEKAN